MGRGYSATPCVPDGCSNMSSVPGQALSYPGKILLLDVCLLLLMAVLETLRLYWGVRGNLQESERCVGFSLALTLATTLFAVYFLLWQAYVLQADIIIGAVLLVLYGLSGALGLVTLARFMRSDHHIEGWTSKFQRKKFVGQTGAVFY
uniref:Transmembrane protein 80 n=1 Tax=Paramormyrops kingsleyae TaxID=1676925 RepID=A0A3B3TFR9_9TELE